MKAIQIEDACILAKAYVTKGIAISRGIGKGPGPVRHTGFPDDYMCYPTVALSAVEKGAFDFKRMRPSDFGTILPLVDSVSDVEKICNEGTCSDLQLRLKITDEATIESTIAKSAKICEGETSRQMVSLQC